MIERQLHLHQRLVLTHARRPCLKAPAWLLQLLVVGLMALTALRFLYGNLAACPKSTSPCSAVLRRQISPPWWSGCDRTGIHLTEQVRPNVVHQPNISACIISACRRCVLGSPARLGIVCSRIGAPWQVGCIHYLYGFCCKQLSGVRYHMCNITAPLAPKIVSAAVAGAYLPAGPPSLLHSSGSTNWTLPKAAHSRSRGNSGRMCACLGNSNTRHGQGSSSTTRMGRWGSPCLTFCMVAALCSMLLRCIRAVAFRACRGVLHWLASGLLVLYGRVAPPVLRRWIGVWVSRRRLGAFFPVC